MERGPLKKKTSSSKFYWTVFIHVLIAFKINLLWFENSSLNLWRSIFGYPLVLVAIMIYWRAFQIVVQIFPLPASDLQRCIPFLVCCSIWCLNQMLLKWSIFSDTNLTVQLPIMCCWSEKEKCTAVSCTAAGPGQNVSGYLQRCVSIVDGRWI